MGARAPGRLDLSLLGDTPLARMQDAANIGEKLAPIFEVNFTPHRLDVLAGARLQARVALDSGGGREAAGSTPTSEVEIECLEGDPAARSTSRSAG
jgi:inorganic triphosphatase YgiF